ncbi:MAG: hypothetical protein R3D05_05760 [Dongiaceae bacterium]
MKGARSEQPDAADRKRGEANAATPFGDGLPRFQPQPGGFGRRATPVSKPVAVVTNDAATGEPEVGESEAGEIKLGLSAPPQITKTELRFGSGQRVAPATGPVLGDIPARLADWLMRELKDQRGIHCETMLTVVGALCGYAAQQALWEGMVKSGKLAITEAFKIVETPSGETLFFGDAVDTLLVSVEPKQASVWKIVAGGALTGGGDHLPDIDNLLRYCEATAGTSQFGLPRLPDDHLPGILPRAALDRFWPGTRLLLALAEPSQWPLHMAHAAQKLMHAMRGSIAPDLAVKIVMEAAVPMSRVDPTTVPNN